MKTLRPGSSPEGQDLSKGIRISSFEFTVFSQLVSEGSLVAQLLASRWDRADLKKEFESHGLADSTLAKLALSSAKAPFRSSEPDESSRERKDAGLPAPAETPPSAVQTPRRQRSASARSSREGGFEEGKGARLESAAASGGASAAETEGELLVESCCFQRAKGLRSQSAKCVFFSQGYPPLAALLRLLAFAV